jgi:hypothetical protein
MDGIDLYKYTKDWEERRYARVQIDTDKVAYDRSRVDLNPQTPRTECNPLNSGVNFGLT